MKEYYKKNQEKNKEKITCECGVKHARANKSRHEKRKKHLIYVNNNI
jgi:hypothetical protein